MSIEPSVTNVQLQVSLTRLETRLEGMSEDIHRLEVSIDTFINGSNGRAGVLERIALTEQAVVGLTARVVSAETRSQAQPIQRPEGLVLTGKHITAAIGLAVALATIIGQLIKMLPGGSIIPGH